MINDEAIDIIMNEKACVEYQEFCEHDCKHCSLAMTDSDILEAYDMAIEALKNKNEAEKYRTPMKVKIVRSTDPDAIESFECVCPRCKHWRDEEAMVPYCLDCGQALDWSDIENKFDEYMEGLGYHKRES